MIPAPSNPPSPGNRHEPHGVVLSRCARPSAAHWPGARRYLTAVRRLDPGLIDLLHADGTVYANDCGSVVFLHRSRHGHVLGASLRSVHGDFMQEIGSKRTCWFILGDLANATRIVVTKGPIDALSFHQLHPHPRQAVLGIGGRHLSLELIALLATRPNAEPVFALDNSDVSERSAVRVRSIWRRANVSRPLLLIKPATTDWNTDLTTGRIPAYPTQPQPMTLLGIFGLEHHGRPLLGPCGARRPGRPSCPKASRTGSGATSDPSTGPTTGGFHSPPQTT